MRKKIILVFSLIMTMLLTACTPNMQAFLGVSQKLNAWEATKESGKVEVEVEAFDKSANKKVKVEIPAKFEGISQKEKAQMSIEYDLSNFKKLLQEDESAPEKKLLQEAESAPEIKVPDKFKVEIFVDGNKIYVDKAAFKTLADLSGKKMDIKEDYVLLDASEDKKEMDPSYDKLMEYSKSGEFTADLIKFTDQALKGFKPSKDIEIKGNTYKYEASLEEILKDANAGLNIVAKNWDKASETLIPMLEKMGIKAPKEDIKKAFDNYKENDLTKSLPLDEKALKDSKVEYSLEVKNDNEYETECEIKLVIPELMTMTVESEVNAKREKDVTVQIPTSFKKFSQADLMKLFRADNSPIILVSVEGKMIEFEDQEPVIKNSRTLIPFRGVLENLGAEVNWDQEKKMVTTSLGDKKIEMTIGQETIKVDGKDVKLDVAPMIINNRTMIPLRGVLENLGYKVGFEKVGSEKDGLIYSIDITK